MDYEQKLREKDDYSEIEIQTKIEQIIKLSKLSFNSVKKNESYINLDNDSLIALKELIKDKKHVKGFIKNIDKRLNKTSVRKQTDYQWSELVVALCLSIIIDLELISFDYLKTKSYELYENEKLICKKDTLDNYLKDLEISFDLKKYKEYINNFNTTIIPKNISKVYLTGKSYSGFQKIVDLNKDFGKKKPNSDVYFELSDGSILGISCKQSKGCPCTNKVVELNNELLCQSREKLFNDNDITIENYREKRGQNGEISKVLCNHFCTTGELQDYWKLLIQHILDNKEYFIQGVINSMCQGSFLPYTVYEYDGEEVVDTKQRCLEKDMCDIRNSEIFCWGKKGPRKASKIWFDFLYEKEVLYSLEVRFKGIYFGKGGQPQLFIYKESKEDIESYIAARYKHNINSQ